MCIPSNEISQNFDTDWFFVKCLSRNGSVCTWMMHQCIIKLCNMGHPSETHLEHQSREISCLSVTSVLVVQSFCDLVESTGKSLPCYVQNFKAIGLLQYKLRANETLSLRWVSDVYYILHKAPVWHRLNSRASCHQILYLVMTLWGIRGDINSDRH